MSRLLRVYEFSREAWLERLPESLRIYTAAMAYPPAVGTHRAASWAEHAARPGWRAYGGLRLRHDTPAAGPLLGPTGLPAGAALLGVGYCFTGARGQWWHEQVRDVAHQLPARRHRAAVLRVLDDYAELAEIHVDPAAQGAGLGERLLRALLYDRPERHLLLSTPEVPGEDNRAWRLYRRLGFTDLLRGFRFAGDDRRFAVLCLPLALRGRRAPGGASPGRYD